MNHWNVPGVAPVVIEILFSDFNRLFRLRATTYMDVIFKDVRFRPNVDQIGPKLASQNVQKSKVTELSHLEPIWTTLVEIWPHWKHERQNYQRKVIEMVVFEKKQLNNSVLLVIFFPEWPSWPCTPLPSLPAHPLPPGYRSIPESAKLCGNINSHISAITGGKNARIETDHNDFLLQPTDRQDRYCIQGRYLCDSIK